MTDAALEVTQSRVEAFATAYLELCGCSVQQREDELVVTVPETASTSLLDDGTSVVVCSSDPERIGDDLALHSESELYQALLREATEGAPIGRVSLMDADIEIRLPDWLVQSDVSVASTQFMPYYDRSAVVGLFRIGIETVSEYQTSMLRMGAVDSKSLTELPALADRLRTQATPGSAPIDATATTLDAETVHSALETLGDLLVEQTQPEIKELQAGATRAAGAELEEYRQLQDQRIDELEGEISNISATIDQLSTSVEEAEGQAERLEALQERKEAKAKRDELRSELTQLTDARSAGFPEKRREVADRHSLEVKVEPLTVTEYQYEQGELEVTIADDDVQTSLRIGYGNGVGVTESLACERCGSTLSGENPLRLDGDAVCCTTCQR